MKNEVTKLLLFHFTVPPYRVDFFNSLNGAFDMRFCAFSDHMISQPINYEKLKESLTFEPHWLFDRYYLGLTRIPKGIITQIRDFSPDIVLVSEYGVVTIMVLLYKYMMWKKFKVVSLCDDSYNQISEKNDFRWTHRLARKIITPFLDEVVLIEPESVEWYRKHYGKGVFFPIIRNEGVLRRQYESLIPNSEQIRKSYQIEGKCVFLFVGRLVTIKNVGLLINAFSELDQKDSALVIIGDGPEKMNLQEQARSCKEKIIFTGRLEGSDLFAWYNVADCFVLPSTIEPFGAVTNEALLAGCWCLVSKRAGSQCLIKEGYNGFTFDPTNVDDLIEKMKWSQKKFCYKKSNIRDNKMIWRYNDLMDKLVDRFYSLSSINNNDNIRG